MDFGQDKETKITLFGPVSGKNLFRIYPELSNYQAFKDLSNEELHYAWLIGIPGSPVDEEWDDASRRRSAASKAFKRDKDTAERYVAGEVPDKVKLAIKKIQRVLTRRKAYSQKNDATNFPKLGEAYRRRC